MVPYIQSTKSDNCQLLCAANTLPIGSYDATTETVTTTAVNKLLRHYERNLTDVLYIRLSFTIATASEHRHSCVSQPADCMELCARRAAAAEAICLRHVARSSCDRRARTALSPSSARRCAERATTSYGFTTHSTRNRSFRRHSFLANCLVWY